MQQIFIKLLLKDMNIISIQKNNIKKDEFESELKELFLLKRESQIGGGVGVGFPLYI